MRIEIDSYWRVKFGYVERAYLNPHSVHSSMAMGLSRGEVEASVREAGRRRRAAACCSASSAGGQLGMNIPGVKL